MSLILKVVFSAAVFFMLEKAKVFNNDLGLLLQPSQTEGGIVWHAGGLFIDISGCCFFGDTQRTDYKQKLSTFCSWKKTFTNYLFCLHCGAVIPENIKHIFSVHG